VSLLRRALRAVRPARRVEPLPPALLRLDDQELTVVFRRNARAKRMVLRLGRNHGEAVLTLPKRAGRAEALRFVEGSAAWLKQRLAVRPRPVALIPGAHIPYRGVPHEIAAAAGHRGAISLDAERRTIAVPGDAVHLPRRLTDWLKLEAKRDLTDATRRYARAMGVACRRIAIRDQKSRWGSCSSSGEISYSWRLILSPPEVLDYVAAHETAHLRHMDHGPRFWRLVLTHCPHARTAKQWLKRHAGEVHRYGGTGAAGVD
jgi:predicted metal-dependent hydrolase